MFDIYLYRGYKTTTDFGEIFKVIQITDKDKFLLCLRKEKPGFLGFNLSYDVARELLRIFINLETRVNGRVYPIRYRDEKPRFTEETAYPIAEKAIKEQQAKYPDITFSPIIYAPAYSSLGELTFLSGSKQWVNEGQGLGVSIDVLDGHIWADDEEEKWAQEE
jgi:hypothetical protein